MAKDGWRWLIKRNGGIVGGPEYARQGRVIFNRFAHKVLTSNLSRDAHALWGETRKLLLFFIVSNF
jgi:hypothetical protein